MIARPISRRSLLKSSAGAVALMAMSHPGWAQEVKRGGRLIVAADSEPANLNPAIVASNGVFFVASKVVEPLAEASYDGEDGLAPRLATVLGGLGRRQDRHLQAARGRDLARRQAVHLGRRRLLGAGGLEAAAESRPGGVQEPRGRRHARRPDRDLPLLHADAAAADPQRPAGAHRGAAEARLRGHRHRREPGQHDARSAPARSSSPSTGPASTTCSQRNEDYWGEGLPLPRRDRLPGAARPRRGGRRARGRGDPARRLLGGAARRPRPHLARCRHQGLSPTATRR